MDTSFVHSLVSGHLSDIAIAASFGDESAKIALPHFQSSHWYYETDSMIILPLTPAMTPSTADRNLVSFA